MKYFRLVKCFVLLALFLIPVSVFSKIKDDAVYLDVEFSEPQITQSVYSPAYSHIKMKGMLSLGEVGEPVLPIKGLKVLIPPRKAVEDVKIILGEKVVLHENYKVEPGQRQYPLSEIGKIKITPDVPKSEVYSLKKYPLTSHKLISLQKKLGHSIAIINLSPVEYNPFEEKISYYKKMSIVIKLKSDLTTMTLKDIKTGPRLRTKTKVREKDREFVRRLIDNKGDIEVYNSELEEMGSFIRSQSPQDIGTVDPSLNYQYVIITAPDFVSAFEPLRQKRAENDGATIVTTDWIYSNYSGARPDGGTDDQTKIRNFIIDAHNNWGTRYVLLGGDADGRDAGWESQKAIIPVRGLVSFDKRVDNIAADLYYACLEGTFDDDKNGIYGEYKSDKVNFMAEVYVGRAPVDSVQEVTNFVNKTLSYETGTDEYFKNNYMVGQRLGFGGISEYASACMEEIRLGSSTAGFITEGFLSNPNRAVDVKTLYDSDETRWLWTDLVDIMNDGVHILNNLGHGNTDTNMKLIGSLVDELVNNKYFIVYTQACFSGSFDNGVDGNHFFYTAWDCIGEHFVTNSAGAVAFIGNSRYGWGARNSTSGASQYFNRQFWDALFSEGIYELGKMNQDSKEDNIPYMYDDYIRWCYYDLNLLGDPALVVRIPDDLVVHCDSYNVTSSKDKFRELVVTFEVFNQDAFNVSAKLISQDPCITIENNEVNYGDMLKGESKDNSLNPYKFKIVEGYSLPRTVKFTLVVNADGYYKEEALSVYYMSNVAPVADAGPDKSSDSGVLVNFDGSNSHDSDGTISSYNWNFGDGTSESGMTVSHTYNTIGMFTATLTVTDDEGAVASDNCRVAIGKKPPVADAGPDRISEVGMPVIFDGSGSYDPDGTIKSYEWRFDGELWAMGEKSDCVFSYSTAGIHFATLKVYDNDGLTNIDTCFVTVNPNTTPPTNISNFNVYNIGTGKQLELSWNNPSDPDFKGVKILRKEGTPPADLNDNSAITIYNDNGLFHLDASVISGVDYFYKVFAYDSYYNYSSGVSGNNKPSVIEGKVVFDPVYAGVVATCLENNDYYGKYDSSSSYLFWGPAFFSMSSHRAFIKWDVSILPSSNDITITGLEFRYAGYSNNANYLTSIKSLETDPQIINDNTNNKLIYDDISDGSIYLANDLTFPASGINTISLGLDAVNNLSLTDKDWWGIGISKEDSTNSHIDVSDSLYPINTTYPKLVVTFEPNMPDLKIRDIHIDGKKILHVKAGNVGKVKTPRGVDIRVGIYVDGNLTWIRDLKNGLNRGQTKTITVEKSQALSGRHKIKVVVDLLSVIDEAREDNNTKTKNIDFK